MPRLRACKEVDGGRKCGGHACIAFSSCCANHLLFGRHCCVRSRPLQAPTSIRSGTPCTPPSRSRLFVREACTHRDRQTTDRQTDRQAHTCGRMSGKMKYKLGGAGRLRLLWQHNQCKNNVEGRWDFKHARGRSAGVRVERERERERRRCEETCQLQFLASCV